jgi:hypothetical protein
MLRAIGLLDLLALIAVLLPHSSMSVIHQALGLGAFPEQPIVGYLARCTSIWYASYGLLLWFVSCNVEKYSLLITCLAATMFLQGFIVVGIDVAEGMPDWWIAIEGPCCSSLGAALLLLQWSANQHFDREMSERT